MDQSQDGARITIESNNSLSEAKYRAELTGLDLRDERKLFKLIRKGNPDRVRRHLFET